MNKNFQDIPYLNKESMQAEIQMILQKGLDPKVSFWSYLVTMYKQVGLRFMFKDIVEILYTLIIACTVIGAFILSSTKVVDVHQINLYTVIFIWSPITYFVMAYLFFIKQKRKPTYEVEMTCKYNLHQLAAFRMLVFSVISMIMNGLFIYVLLMDNEFSFFYSLLLSSSSLFLFALLFLYVQLHAKSRMSKYVLFFGWIVMNLIASYFSSEIYLFVLKQIPIYIYGVIAIASVVLYVKSLKGLLVLRKMKGLM